MSDSVKALLDAMRIYRTALDSIATSYPNTAVGHRASIAIEEAANLLESASKGGAQ